MQKEILNLHFYPLCFAIGVCALILSSTSFNSTSHQGLESPSFETEPIGQSEILETSFLPSSVSPLHKRHANHTELGVPKDKDDRDDLLISRPQYTLSYNNKRGGANWVCWNLNEYWYGDVSRRQGPFLTDTTLPKGVQRITHNDYTGSGFDRGHLVRSQERTSTREDNDATFFMTNILPQTHELNSGPWLSLEVFCEVQAKKRHLEMFLIAGGIYDTKPSYLSGKGKGRVAIPISTWKIVVFLEQGQGVKDVTTSTRVIAVNIPNQKGKEFKKTGWRKYLTTVDELERLTGYDFLSLVPEEIQSVIESKID